MTKKRLITATAMLLLVAATVLTLCACTASFDDYYDDQRIAHGSGTGMRVGSTQTSWNDKTTWSVDSFGGITTLFDLNYTEGMVLPIVLDYMGGQLKVVAVSGDNVYKLIENDSCDGLSATLAAGKYKVKLVGNEAKFKIVYGKNALE